MSNRQKTGLRISAAVLFIVGFVLVMNDSSAGWFLIILGITYLGISTRTGLGWTASNSSLAKWGLVGLAVLLVLLTILVGAVLLLK